MVVYIQLSSRVRAIQYNIFSYSIPIAGIILSTNTIPIGQRPNLSKVLLQGFDLEPLNITFYLFLGFFNFALKETASWTFSIYPISAFRDVLLHFRYVIGSTYQFCTVLDALQVWFLTDILLLHSTFLQERLDRAVLSIKVTHILGEKLTKVRKLPNNKFYEINML